MPYKFHLQSKEGLRGLQWPRHWESYEKLVEQLGLAIQVANFLKASCPLSGVFLGGMHSATICNFGKYEADISFHVRVLIE